MADPSILFPLTDTQRRTNDRHIAHLNAIGRGMVRAFLLQAWAHGHPIVFTQSRRTDAYQFGLFKQGRDLRGSEWVVVDPAHVVTRAATVEDTAHGCICGLRHIEDADCACACALDFAFLIDGKIVGPRLGKGNDSFDADLPWADVGAIAKAQGFEWGGDFPHFADLGHVQLRNWRALRADYARRSA